MTVTRKEPFAPVSKLGIPIGLPFQYTCPNCFFGNPSPLRTTEEPAGPEVGESKILAAVDEAVGVADGDAVAVGVEVGVGVVVGVAVGVGVAVTTGVGVGELLVLLPTLKEEAVSFQCRRLPHAGVNTPTLTRYVPVAAPAGGVQV